MQELQTEELVTTKDAFGRQKGLSWFPFAFKRDVLVIGAGGIGSICSFLLGRIGCNIHIFDMDSFEEHNKTGQLVRTQDIGKNKAIVSKEIINEFCDEEVEVEIFTEKYKEDSITNNIVICAVDNMACRALSFKKWKEYLEENPEERKDSLYIDGRLSPNCIQIYCIKGENLSDIAEYENNHLFKDEEIEELDCTMKQTSYSSFMIGSHIIGFLTNFLAPENYSVPFRFEYIIPLNHLETY